MGICHMSQGAQTGALYQLRRVGWERVSRGRRRVYTYDCDVWRKTTKFCKAINLQFKKKKGRAITLQTKVHIVKIYSFSSSHVQMWELDQKEGWVPKNWCFWIVLEKLLRVSWAARRSSQSILKEINPGYSVEELMLKLHHALWPLDVKSQLTGKDCDSGQDWRQKEKGVAEDEMVR